MVRGLDVNLAAVHSSLEGLEVGYEMADQHQNSSVDYSGSSSADETNSSVVENSMWDEWTHPVGNVGDEVSTSNFLTTSSSSSRLAFHQTDMLSSWMTSTLLPLGLAAPEPSVESDPHPAISFMHEASIVAALENPDCSSLDVTTYTPEDHVSPSLIPPVTSVINGPKPSAVISRHAASDPQSPSSPLAIQNGMLNPLGDPWDHGSSHWPNSPASGTSAHTRIFIPDHSPSAIEEGGGSLRVASRPCHTDIFIGPNGTFESTPGGWTPQFYDGTAATTMRPMKMMASLREAGESCTSPNLHSQYHHHVAGIDEIQTMGSLYSAAEFSRRADHNVWLGKHRLELSLDGDDHHAALQVKRAKCVQVGDGKSRLERTTLNWGDQGRTRGESESLRTSTTYHCGQAMDHMVAIGPALNTNGKPRARRGSATDPQSVYARQRRERINDRMKTLQHLVPNGAKVDIVTMLDEAYDYVKFLQYQLMLLKSDELWVLATPYNYNGMDISLHLPSALQTQELETSSA